MQIIKKKKWLLFSMYNYFIGVEEGIKKKGPLLGVNVERINANSWNRDPTYFSLSSIHSRWTGFIINFSKSILAFAHSTSPGLIHLEQEGRIILRWTESGKQQVHPIFFLWTFSLNFSTPKTPSLWVRLLLQSDPE